MELRLLIIGIIAFIFAKLSKYLKKKDFFKNKKVLIAFNGAFALLAGGMVYYLLNFMASNGIQGGLSAGTAALIIMGTLVYTAYNVWAANKADAKAADKIYAVNLD